MPIQSILNENVRDKIYSLEKTTLSEAQKFLIEFHKSNEYTKLTSTELTDLCEEDIICLALTHKPEDANKMDIKIFKNAILNVYLKSENDLNDDEKEDLREDDFDSFCYAIENDKKNDNRLKSAVSILKAMNYSQNIFPMKNKEFRVFRCEYTSRGDLAPKKRTLS